MKYWISIFAFLAAFSGAVQAAPTMSERAEEFAQKLNLDEEQMEDVKAILQESFKSLEGLRDESMSKLEKLKELRDNAQETSASLSEILDDEQLAKFEEMRIEFLKSLKEQRDAMQN